MAAKKHTTPRPCSIEDCQRSHEAKGYCSLHYKRLKAHGDPLGILHRTGCEVDGCERTHLAKGYCIKHYWKQQAYGDPLRRRVYVKKGRLCSIEDCGRGHEAKGYCRLHYRRHKTYRPVSKNLRKNRSQTSNRVAVDVRPKHINMIRRCSVIGCEVKHFGLSFCRPHYRGYKKTGDPLKGPLSPMPLRFWEKAAITANPDKCWIWQAFCQEYGYGTFVYNGRSRGAHRVAWILTHGRQPTGGIVRHSCDNPPCVNPNHLLEGTQKDNRRDSVRRGRQAKGERSGSSKLTEPAVHIIKKYLLQDLSMSAIARAFGVDRTTIAAIKYGEAWRHVK